MEAGLRACLDENSTVPAASWEGALPTSSRTRKAIPAVRRGGQKFVADPRIVAELATSRARLDGASRSTRRPRVQFGFTNSHPDFTKGGDYMWATRSARPTSSRSAAYAIKRLGLNDRRSYLNTDWGRTSKDIFVRPPRIWRRDRRQSRLHGDEKDFRSTSCAWPSTAKACRGADADGPTTPTPR